jgi:exosortase C (VPDSG-CTERM-specific)
MGAGAFFGARMLNRAGISSPANYDLTFTAIAFLCFLAAGGFLFLGLPWLKSAAFPLLFLLFAVPLPDNLLEWLETGLKVASAEVADVLFSLAGIPFLRDGQVFQLPGIAVEVARECSGIRSSWVLFMTSFLAAHLFLRAPWRRAVLVAVVIPLGILRNGFRILVIGFLCVQYGPQMINSPIHRRGGPLFFALSLVPLLAFLWWMRAREQQGSRKPPVVSQSASPLQ